MRGTETVTRRRPGGIDQWGDPTAGTDTTIKGCIVWSRTATEVTSDSGQRLLTGYMVLVPPGQPDVVSSDFLRLDTRQAAGDPDEWWAVTGRPAPQIKPNGSNVGLMVELATTGEPGAAAPAVT